MNGHEISPNFMALSQTVFGTDQKTYRWGLIRSPPPVKGLKHRYSFLSRAGIVSSRRSLFLIGPVIFIVDNIPTEECYVPTIGCSQGQWATMKHNAVSVSRSMNFHFIQNCRGNRPPPRRTALIRNSAVLWS